MHNLYQRLRAKQLPDETVPGSFGAIATWAAENNLHDLLAAGADDSTIGVGKHMCFYTNSVQLIFLLI
jgi:hypothetical protein